ncbi:MAG: hypothetical protein GY869_07235 [Planctomycetes bacterium]|nr:hypothetical protein [Planctomycetota bacterium]
MPETICAQVNPRLLSKADRLFTGTVEGRVIEILQNARRSGATEVRITNEKGFVTAKDNGSGITDFQKLLDLGGSNWNQSIEAGEDPAGVGLFSLAPREVTIVSGSKKLVIDQDGWTGKPIPVEKVRPATKGTCLKFKDESPWAFSVVEKYVVFTGLKVIVDRKCCHTMPFCREVAVYHKNPGCRIEITSNLSKYHQQWNSSHFYGEVLVNFHGQVVQLDYWPTERSRDINILVDIADDTDIRLMLPARTMLVENTALAKLKAAIEIEYYRYFQRQEKHTLFYQEYLRARDLGIPLPEAEPKFQEGLIWCEYNEVVEVELPQDFQLQDCYLCGNANCKDDLAETNAHLLAALGNFQDKPFVPVMIDKGYQGYSWSKLPQVTQVQVTKGQEKLRQSLCCGEIVCFDHLSITVHTSDGKIFHSEVAMAVINETPQGKSCWHNETVCVTSKARRHLSPDNIWFHLGGYSEDGDTYDTQLYYFEKNLDEFWNELIGPYEALRQHLIDDMYRIRDKWRKVVLTDDGRLELIFQDGKKVEVKPDQRA